MKCPHCSTALHDIQAKQPFGKEQYARWSFLQRECPACARSFLSLVAESGPARDGTHCTKVECLSESTTLRCLILPKEVPDRFARDYREACLALEDIPQASATISRRCLQHLLREEIGVKPGELAMEIQEVLEHTKLPALVFQALDVVRETENAAVHPVKGTSAGEIVEVEGGEADWNLDLLDMLFDYFFVQPAHAHRPQAAPST